MKRKRIATALLAALCLAGTLAGCGKKEEEPVATPEPAIEMADTVSGQTLTAGAAADNVFSLAVDFDRGLNPLRTTSSASLMVAGLVYDNVFEVDAQYNLSSRIVTDWKMNDEATFFTLVVDNTIPMHDGGNLRAYDVAYSLQRAQNYSSYFASRMTSINGISAYSDTELCISTKYADAQLLYRLTIPVIRSGSILSDAPAGSGPYKFGYSGATDAPEPTPDGESGETGGEPTPSPSPTPEPEILPDLLVAFASHADAATLPLDTIYLREYKDPAATISEYESGLVDLVVNDASSNYSMGYGGMNEKRVYPTTHMHYVGFNGYSDFLCYADYRHAISRIVDRAGIVKECLDGLADPAALPVNPASALYDTTIADTLGYSQEACLAELANQGARDLDDDGEIEFSLSGSKIEFSLVFIVCSNTASKVTAARKIAEDMQELGIPVTLRELTWKEYQAALLEPYDEENRKASWDMYYDEVALTADWDITPFLRKVEKPKDEDAVIDPGLNYGRWDLTAMRAAFESYMAASDLQRAEQAGLYFQEFAASVPFVPVCFERRTAISHLGIIRGMNPNSFNLFSGIGGWTIQLGS